eukprot:490264_1
MDIKLITCNDLDIENIEHHEAIQSRIQLLMDSLIEKDIDDIQINIKTKEKYDHSLFTSGHIQTSGDHEWSWNTYPTIPDLVIDGETIDWNIFNNPIHISEPPQIFAIFKSPIPNQNTALEIYNNYKTNPYSKTMPTSTATIKISKMHFQSISDNDASIQSDTISTDSLNIENDLMVTSDSSINGSIDYSTTHDTDSISDTKADIDVIFINTHSTRHITDIFDLQDGIIFAYVLDNIKKGIINWKKMKKNVKNKFDMILNCDYVISVMKDILCIDCCGIIGDDIVSGNGKYIKTLLWRIRMYYKSYHKILKHEMVSDEYELEFIDSGEDGSVDSGDGW